MLGATEIRTALESLTPLVYEELRGLPIGTWLGSVRATRCKPTALVHEAYLRLIDGKKVQWQNRAHFFAVSAQLMRRILGRSRSHQKRGGKAEQVSLDEALVVTWDKGSDLVALDDALSALATVAPG